MARTTTHSISMARARINLRAVEVRERLRTLLRGQIEPIDEVGGARNSDEGNHIAAGVVIAGSIAAGVGAFVADRLGLLSGE